MPQDAGFPDPTPNAPRSRPDADPVVGRIDPPAGYADPPPPSCLTAGPDLGALLRSLRHRWMAAVAFGVPLALIAAAAAWFLLSPKYTAFAQFHVDAVQQLTFGTKDARYDYPVYIRTLAAKLVSRPVIMQALKSDEMKRLNLEARVPDPALYLAEMLKTEFNDQAEFLTLTMDSNDAAEAVAAVKADCTAFMDQIVYAETRSKAQRLTDLEKVYGETSENLRKKKADLKKLADSLGTTDRDSLTQQQMQLLESERDARSTRNQLASELFKAQADLNAQVTRLETLKKVPVTCPDLEAALDTDVETKQLTERLKRVDGVLSGFAEEPREPTAIMGRGISRELKEKLEQRKKEVEAKLKRSAPKSVTSASWN